MGFLFASTGGLNRDNVVLNNVLRYEPTLDKWIKMANMNKSRARHGKPKRSIIGCNVSGTMRDIVVLLCTFCCTFSVVGPTCSQILQLC